MKTLISTIALIVFVVIGVKVIDAGVNFSNSETAYQREVVAQKVRYAQWEVIKAEAAKQPQAVTHIMVTSTKK